MNEAPPTSELLPLTDRGAIIFMLFRGFKPVEHSFEPSGLTSVTFHTRMTLTEILSDPEYIRLESALTRTNALLGGGKSRGRR